MTAYISTTIKILEKPRKKFYKASTQKIEVRAQICQVRTRPLKTLTSVIFWGNLGHVVLKYYQPNDYLLVEGYISIKYKKNLLGDKRPLKYIEIIVFKVYPSLLN